MDCTRKYSGPGQLRSWPGLSRRLTLVDGSGESEPESIRIEHGKVSQPVVAISYRLLRAQSESLRQVPHRIDVRREERTLARDASIDGRSDR